MDEVGTDGLTHLDKDKQRFLSLTGVAMRVDYVRDEFARNLDLIKARVFEHDPDDPIVFHRKDIMGLKGPYECLRDVGKKALFDEMILKLFQDSEYTVITALIDKKWMVAQEHWARNEPYHFLMEILVEKYLQFLERMGTIGDIMPESRQSKDDLLQKAFDGLRRGGCAYVSAPRIASAIRAKTLKFRTKLHSILRVWAPCQPGINLRVPVLRPRAARLSSVARVVGILF
ncbi:hypothetical protein [Mesorhizobium sp. Cs1321R2N1]|uniref:hypothetical protein n=1 Tax=Mesorhizobium sp. Cs1321R2N1 TaxID=3015174 RepID=UPI00301BC284